MKKLLTLALCVTLCMLCMTAASADYTAGTYTGVAAGNNGDIAVEVTFSETEITAIEITSHSETAGISGDRPYPRGDPLQPVPWR